MSFKTKREVGTELAKNGQLDLAEVLIGAEANTADAKALNDLGVVNEMKYNSRNALYHYLHAAALGSVEAVFNIGYMYERGSGITLACGSGACACSFVSNKFFGLGSKILASLDGGKLLIKIGKTLQMIGECKFVYSGEIYVKN